jgi:hypothetical protein
MVESVTDLASESGVLDGGVDPFNGADFYSIDRWQETLKATTPAEAVNELLESDELRNDLHAGVPTAEECEARAEALRAACDRLAPLTIYGHKHEVVSEQWMAKQVDSLLENLTADYVDEFGEDSKGLRDAAMSKDEMLAAVQAFVGRVKPWLCRDAGQRTYSADELWTLLCPYYGHTRGVE